MKKLALNMMAMTVLCGLAFLASVKVTFSQEQVKCLPTPELVDQLNDEYGETMKTVGLTHEGESMVVQFANTQTGTWTIAVLGKSNNACVVAVGENWQSFSEEDEPT